MTIRQVAWFVVAYIVLVAAAMWFNVAVLCEGDAKYDQGCGGLGVYVPLWLIFLAPLPTAAIALELWRRSGPPPKARLVAYLVVIVAVAEIGFLVIDKFPMLLALEAAVIALAFGVRLKTARQRTPPRSSAT